MNLLKTTFFFVCGFSLQCAFARPVSLADEWNFFDPEGNSSISNQSASGFDVTIADIRKSIPDPDNGGAFLEGNAVRPRVYQVFEDLDMTKIGDAVEVSFDLELLTPILESNRGDVHFSLFDTSTNYELLPLIHLGPNSDREAVGDFIKFRIDGFVTPNSAAFDPANITGMGSGGNSRGTQASNPGKPLAEVGYVHNFQLRIERISEAEHSCNIDWSYRNAGPAAENPSLGTSTYSFASYDETTGVIDGQPDAATSDIWANQKVSQFNGFGIMLHEDDPFDQDDNDSTFDQGTIRVSNFAVEHTTAEPLTFSITDIVKDEDGNLIRWESIDGATYSLWTSEDLMTWSQVGGSILSTGDTSEYLDDSSPSSESRFYHVRRDPQQ